MGWPLCTAAVRHAGQGPVGMRAVALWCLHELDHDHDDRAAARASASAPEYPDLQPHCRSADRGRLHVQPEHPRRRALAA